MSARRRRGGGRRSSPRRYDRMERVNELVREIVAERVRGLSDPRLEPVTITGADVTADLSFATIYFAALGAEGDAQVEAATAALDSARPLLRTVVGAEARLRQTPELRFALDPGIQHGQRVEEILRGLHDHDDREVP